MATVYLIRHGEPEVRGVFLGQMDPGLRAPVKIDLDVPIVYTSPLRRARETYIECARVEILPDLREIGYGEWTGKSWEEIEAGWPELARRKMGAWLAVTPPGGEPWDEFAARVGHVWDRVRQGLFPAAIVAHQAVNAALAQMIAGRDPERFQQGYGEVIAFEYGRA
jgi:broad specificity phosphatase PhoE